MSDTRTRILAASVALVEEHGVRAVSFREVARRAGVSHQAPYHIFGNHLGILRAIAELGFGRLADAMSAAASEQPDATDALVAAGVAYVDFARSHVGHFRVMFDHSLVPLNDADDPLVDAERTHAVLASLVARAHADGAAADLPRDVVVAICWSTVHGLANLLVDGVLDAKQPMTESERHAFTERVVRGLGGLLSRG